MRSIDEKINEIVARYRFSGIENEVDYDRFYLYSIVTHSTAIEGSTITEIENQLLFDEGISPAGHSIIEQMINLDLRDAYMQWMPVIKESEVISDGMLRDMSASVMRRTGSVYHTATGDFDSSKGDLRLIGVRAGSTGRSYMAYQKIPLKLSQFCAWLTESINCSSKLSVAERYRLSFAAHYRLVTIHPWVDGNGRTTRLLMNCLQYRFGVPMSKIDKSDKATYIQALVDAREAEDENLFIDRMMMMLAADLERQIERFGEEF